MFRYRTASIALLGTLLLLLFTTDELVLGVQDTTSQTAQPQSQQPDGTTSTTLGTPEISQEGALPAQAQRGGIARNFSEWTRQGGWVMYPIYGVFVLGLGAIIYQFVRIFFDTRNAKPIKSLVEKEFAERRDEHDPQSAVREIWETVKQYPKSTLARLLDKLCDLWHRDPSADVLQVEIKGYLDTVKERYEVGRSFAVLLSDTAGALGLLGTVLGMYQTFMPGRLESAQIITGMGVALVTTIGGLIVSIILNFGISWVNSTFHRHVEGVEERADMFRNRFGKGQAMPVGAPIAAVAAPFPAVAGPVDMPVAATVPEVKVAAPRRVPTSLKILSGNRQTVEAGANLPKALEVAVEDQYGKPMENFPVIFETNGSLITFDNGDTIKQVETDFLGRAKAQARLGKAVGQHKVIARVNGEANLFQEFEIESRPGAPDKLEVLSGHTQIGRPGASLSELLSLKLEDGCGNPVPDQAVIFEVIHNTGRLDHDKTRAEVHTDEEGVAAIGFRLGETAGANIVKAWVKSRSTRKLEASFESMGRE